MEGWMIALIAVGGVLLILLLVLFFGTAQLSGFRAGATAGAGTAVPALSAK